METTGERQLLDGNDIVLETRSLSKRFGGFYAVKDVDLKIKRSSVHAVIGPNGAGKTTFFNLLTKFHTPSSGQILFNGSDITRLGPTAISRRGLVRSFQISSVFGQLSVMDNVRLALQRRSNVALKFWMSNRRLDHLNPEAESLVEQVGLKDFLNVRAGELSYGRKRALEIATTVALDPEVMLLDEPTSGLGAEDIDRAVKVIAAAAKNRTVVMVEHNLGVVEGICDEVTVLQRGEILSQGTYQDVSSDPSVIEAYVGAEDD